MVQERDNRQEALTSLALQIIPPLHSNNEHSIALEATMQSLVLDRQHPIALELAGTSERRIFIVRATTQAALDNVEALLRAQYPQSAIRPLQAHEDPFRLEQDEAITAIELIAGSASFLPLRTWQEAQKEGTDPLLSLLAALGYLPERTRVIAQLGLIPAESNWSRGNLRRAIQNPLEPEREARDRQRMVAVWSGGNYSNILIINIGALITLLFLIRAYIPSWVGDALREILVGKLSQVSASHMFQLILFIGGTFLLEALIVFIYVMTRTRLKNRSLYDPNVVAQKISRMAYRTRLRLYAIGPQTSGNVRSHLNRLSNAREQAKVREGLVLRMVAAYRQFNMANGAFFVPQHIPGREAEKLLGNSVIGGAGWQHGLRASHHLIGVDALASLWHMPHPEALPELALVEHRRSRTLLIPPTVTRQCQEGLPIGYSEHAGYRLPFALNSEFFTYHTLISGKAGEGKSVFMQHIAREAMRSGGMVLIDPFGDLCESILQLVPPERAEDVVFIDLADTTASVGLNPLDVTLGHKRDKFIADLLKMLAQIWASSWTSKMENAFEMSLRTLFEANKILIAQDPQDGPGLQYTLLDILPLLTNMNFCHTLLQEIQDDYLHRWWREYYEPLSPVQQRDVINPIAAKVAKFESVIARRILGQNVSTLNIPQMIQDRKIMLFKLARGMVGNDVTSMIGATVLGLIQNTLEESEEPNSAGNTRLPIIIDEFQRVAGADYRTLSELHKYGVTFFLATQSLEYLQKINPLLWPTLQANVRQTIAFNMSTDDAALLYKDLGVDQEDILHLDISTCYVSMIAAGRRQPTFSLKLNAPAVVNSTLATSIRTRCRVRYTCPIAEVDKRLREAMLRSIRMESDSLPLHYLSEDSAPDAPLKLAPPREAQLEGGRYRQRREQEKSVEHGLRITQYQAKKNEWSNQEDISMMEETSPSDVLEEEELRELQARRNEDESDED